MTGDTFPIHYRLRCQDGPELVFSVLLDKETLDNRSPSPPNPPDWTRLEREQCAQCRMTGAYCPAAMALAEIVDKCGAILSYTEVDAEVETPWRTYSAHTTAQKAVSSLMGLLMPTSGCPSLSMLKPLARFHLPFANREETVFRVAGAYLLAQYFHRNQGESCDLDLAGLQRAYERIQHVNQGVSKRLRTVAMGDTSINGLVLLDLFAQELPVAIDEKLGFIRYLFVDAGGEEKSH